MTASLTSVTFFILCFINNGKGAMEWTAELDAAWLLLKKRPTRVLSTFDPRKEACSLTLRARTATVARRFVPVYAKGAWLTGPGAL